jgi:hypothetical protein
VAAIIIIRMGACAFLGGGSRLRRASVPGKLLVRVCVCVRCVCALCVCVVCERFVCVSQVGCVALIFSCLLLLARP